MHETDETVTVSGESGTLTIPDATLTLEDDEDLPTLTLALDNSSIGEAGGVAAVTASLSGASSAATAVTVSAAPNAGAVATDFTVSTNKTLTIAAGDTDSTGTVTITGVNNAVDAPDKTVTVSATVSGGNGVAVPGTATLTLTDDDGPPTGIALTLTSASGTALSELAENAGATTVTVTATPTGGMAFAADTDVTISVTGSLAATAVDFAAVSDFTIAFSANTASAEGTFTLTPTDDAVHETDETVTVSGESGTLTIPDATLTLEDDEDLPTLTLALDNSSIGEAGGVAAVTASLSGASSAATTVTVSAAANAGAVATDFTVSTNKTLTIAAGDTDSTGTVTITGVNNAVDAPDKTVTVSATVSGGNGVAVPGTATLTLSDDDGPPTGIALTLTSASGTALSEVAENAGATTVTVTATPTGGMAFAADTNVTISVTGSLAATAVDFATVSDFTIAFSANTASAEGTFTLTPTDDAVHETDETVTVSGESGTLTIPDATLTLEDDEDLPTLTLALDNSSIGEAGGVATVTASLSGASSAATTVTVSAAANAGAVVTDFTVSTNKTLTIAAGDTDSTGTVTITGVNNAVDAPDKTVTVSATVSGGNGVAVPGTATLTLSDDDGPPTGIALTLTSASGTALSELAEDAGATTVTVTATPTGGMAFAADTNVTISVTGSLAATAVDFTAVTDFTITIPANTATATGTFTLTPEDDTVDEIDEVIDVTGDSGSLLITKASVALTDDDDTPSGITLSVAPTSVAEEADATDVTVTATVNGNTTYAVEQTVTVAVGAEDDAAKEEIDYTLVADITITIPAGEASATGTFSLDPIGDVIDEGDGETLSVEGSAASGVSVTKTMVTITDNDVAPSAPVNFQATAGDARVTLTWDTANDDTITRWEYQQKQGTGGTYGAWTAITNSGADTTAHALENLTNNTQYFFRLRAVNATGNGASSGELSATPTAGNSPPTVQNPLADLTLVANSTQVVDVSGTFDDHDDDSLTYTAISADTSVATVSLSGTTLTVSGMAAGATTVTVSAADGDGASASDTFKVRVETDTQPVLAAIADQSYTRGVEIEALTLPSSSTGNGTLTYSFSPALPADLSFDATTRTLSGTPTELQASTAYTYKVEDMDEDEATQSFNITVLAPDSIVLSVEPKSVGEVARATPVTVTAEMVGGTSVGVTTVTVKVTGKTASADDFAPVEDFTVTIRDGDSSGTTEFMLTPRSDVLMEGDETVTVSGTADGFTVTGTEVTIEDDVRGATQARTAVNREILPLVTQAMAASTTTAVRERIDAVTSGVGQVPSYNLASHQTLAGVLQTVSDGLRDGTLTVERLLGGSSFVLPLHATNNGQQTGLGNLAIWGKGDYRNLGGGEAIDWDGEILSGHLGVDTRLSADLLAGLAASWSEGSFDYAGLSGTNPVGGSYTNRMTSVHPYVNWSLPAGVDLWGSLGYGWGEIAIAMQDEPQTEVSDTTMQTATVGANGKVLSVEGLIPGGRTILRLKGEALLTKIKVEGDGGAIEPLSLEARRFRLALEGLHEHEMASGGRLVPAVEIGIRHDGGDGLAGTGLELGGGLSYVDPTIGLTVDGRGRWLVTYGEQEYREWGASLLIQLDPGAAGQGLSFNVMPAYGQTASGVTRLWDQGLDGVGEASTSEASPRLEAVVGYGLPTWEGTGLLTPYSGVTLGSGGHQLRLGSTLAVGSSFNVSLEGTQAMRSEAPSRKAPPVYGVRLQADWRF